MKPLERFGILALVFGATVALGLAGETKLAELALAGGIGLVGGYAVRAANGRRQGDE